MHPSKILEVLGAILPGDALEALADEIDDPGARLTNGDLALCGAAFKALGEYFTDKVKAQYAGIEQTAIPSRQGDIIVKSRRPSEYFALNTQGVKIAFPQDEYPELYKLTKVKGSVSLEMPGGLK